MTYTPLIETFHVISLSHFPFPPWCACSGKPLLWIATEASVSRLQAPPHLIRETSFRRLSLSHVSPLWTLPAFCCCYILAEDGLKAEDLFSPYPTSFPPSHYLFLCLLIKPTLHIKIISQPIKNKKPLPSNESFLALLGLTCVLILKIY